MTHTRKYYYTHPNDHNYLSSIIGYFSMLVFQFVVIMSVGLFVFVKTAPRFAPEVNPISPIAEGEVAGINITEPTDTPSIPINTIQEQIFIITPLPTQKTFPKPAKSTYTIAFIGDSMVDTMGNRGEYLEHELQKYYPSTNFKLYNYGIGMTNVEEGLERFDKPFIHQDRDFPPISQIKPDIIIIGSYAYNPKSPHDRNWHWINLTKLVNKSRKITNQVYLLAEIAPLRSTFGKGPMGVNWESNTAYIHSGNIIELLQNTVGLSKELNIPLIDAFAPTLINGSIGTQDLVNPSDGIHPSVKGHEYMAEKIVDALNLWY